MQFRRWFLMVMVMVVGLGAAGLPQTVAAKELCFAGKTDYCLNDPFSLYWENNGGLPVFGYPITPAAPEQNRDTGQTYTTQWVERNRMEVHPENAGTPYEILLGLLGKDRLAQIGRDWQAEPREAGAKTGCLWFEQTGHNVCNQSGNLGFKTYWETHGLKIAGLDTYARSLQLFGLPLTEPRMETNTSGDLVLTQWFERARFEWHPGNSDEYKVLLGLLGKEIQQNIPAPQPLLFEGNGSKVVGPVFVPFGSARVRVWHNGRRNIIVWAYQGERKELLVNEIGGYEGTRLLFGKKDTSFEITADGDWRMSIEPMGYNDAIASAGINGRGDTVSDWFTPVKTGNVPYRFTHTGRSNFIVWLVCSNGYRDLVQNEIGVVDAEAMAEFRSGMCLWDVQADGEWTIAPK